MNVHPIGYRYGSEEIRRVFTDENRMQKMLQVESALVMSLAKLGVIPQSAAEEVKSKATIEIVKPERIREIELETKHDVMALVKALTEQCSPEAGKYVHLTATSYDIVDTAISLQLRDGMDIIIRETKQLLANCLKVVEQHSDTVMVGRTHGQHAIPTTLGFKFAYYAQNIGDNVIELERVRDMFLLGKFSGAVGTYSAQKLMGIDDELEKAVMQELGIKPAPISTQVIPRGNHARILSEIANLASSLEQIAKEIRNLQRTEIGELSEPFGKMQVGSSTMAQKKNPINTENVCSNARLVRGNVATAFENIALEHERDLTNSANERSIFAESFVLTQDMLSRMDKVMSGLVVRKERMQINLDLTKGRIMAEAVITKLVEKGMGRQDAHEVLRKASLDPENMDKHLTEVLKQNTAVTKYLTESEIDEIMKYENYTGLAKEKALEVANRWKN